MPRDNKFAVIPADALFDKRLSNATLRCLSLICYYGAQKASGSWPAYETIAADMDSDRRNVMRYIKTLCECGYITKEKRHRADGSQTSNAYRVAFDIEVPEDALGDGKKRHPGDVVKDARVGVVNDHPASGKIDHPKEQENLTVKKNNKKSIKMTLTAWEEMTGSELRVQQMVSWVKENRLDADKVALLIVEFREMMMANGTQYADFTAAFKNYVRRGFLTVKMAGLLALPDKSQARRMDEFEVQL